MAKSFKADDNKTKSATISDFFPPKNSPKLEKKLFSVYSSSQTSLKSSILLLEYMPNSSFKIEERPLLSDLGAHTMRMHASKSQRE